MNENDKSQIDRELSVIIGDLNAELSVIRKNYINEKLNDSLFYAGEQAQKYRDAIMLLKLVRGKLI